MHRCSLNPTPRTAISARACIPFHLTPTFWTKIFFGTMKTVFFFCCALLRQATLFSCKLLTGSPRTMQLWLKRNLSPLLSLSCLFSISNTGAYYHHFPKFRWFPYYFNKGWGRVKANNDDSCDSDWLCDLLCRLFGTCKMRNYKCQTAVNMGAKYLNMFFSRGKKV